MKTQIKIFWWKALPGTPRTIAMAPHSSTLAWKIPWVEEPGRLQSMGSRRVGHNWSDLAAAAAATYTLGFPCGSAGKESACNVGDLGLIPGLGRSPGEERLPTPVFLGFTGGSAGKESACNVGDLSLIPGLGRSPGEGKAYQLQYSGLENSLDCMYSPWGHKESDTTERLSVWKLVKANELSL